MEFVVKIKTVPLFSLDLPPNVKQDFEPNIPTGLIVTVDDEIYMLDILHDVNSDVLKVGGDNFVTLMGRRNVKPGNYLHFMILKNGPIYLYIYDKSGACHTNLYPRYRRDDRSRYGISLEEPTAGFVLIQPFWINQFNHMLTNNVVIWVANKRYEVQMLVQDNTPCGFIGNSLETVFDRWGLKKKSFIVIEQYPGGFEFKLKMFHVKGYDYLHDSEVLLPHANVLFNKDIVPCHLGPQSHREFYHYAFHAASSTNTIHPKHQYVHFFRKKLNDILTHNGAHIPAWFVKKFNLHQVMSPVTVTCIDFETEMRLKVYGDSRLGESSPTYHVVMKGDWKGLKQHTKLRGDKSVKITFNLIQFEESGYVSFTVY